MVFQVQEKTDKYVMLTLDGKGISFLGGRNLVEYRIEMETLDFYSVNNISHAEAKVLFRRKMEYHVTNTFLQSFILIMVGYLSYYFDVENFTDRIMVALTLMLVVATITSSIQAVMNGFILLSSIIPPLQDLPKTSYYKLIDWWLFFSTNILVVTMLFHTFLASMCRSAAKEKDEKEKADQTSTSLYGSLRYLPTAFLFESSSTSATVWDSTSTGRRRKRR